MTLGPVLELETDDAREVAGHQHCSGGGKADRRELSLLAEADIGWLLSHAARQLPTTKNDVRVC